MKKSKKNDAGISLNKESAPNCQANRAKEDGDELVSRGIGLGGKTVEEWREIGRSSNVHDDNR